MFALLNLQDIENKSFLLDCGDDDVISFQNNSSTHSFSRFRDVVKNIFADRGKVASGVNSELQPQLGIIATDWFHKGVVCEVLMLGDKSWEKGKLRFKITLEFEPDEPAVDQTTASNQPESPLDVIRRQIVN